MKIEWDRRPFVFGEMQGNPSELSALIRDRVKAARKKRGGSISLFAAEAGLSPNSVVSAEKETLIEEILKRQKDGCTERRGRGISRTVIRLMAYIGENPQLWCEKLGLVYSPSLPGEPRSTAASTRKILDSSISLEQAQNLVVMLQGVPSKSMRLELVIELLELK